MDNKNTGDFIAQLRKENNLTQKQLAEMLNVTDKAISRWETGKGYPEVSMLIPLSSALGVSVNELLSGERIEKDKIIDNSNSVIVDTMKDANKKINILNAVITFLFVLFVMLTFYYVPATAGAGDDMGIIFFSILAVFTASISMGFIKTKLKFIAPLISVIVFISSTFIEFEYNPFNYFDAGDIGLYLIVYLVVSLVGMLFGMLISFIVKRILKIRKKD